VYSDLKLKRNEKTHPAIISAISQIPFCQFWKLSGIVK
jgi:hypothetical protein